MPMLIADTSPLVAMLNAKDKHHQARTALFRRFRSPVIAPTPIITEVAYFLRIEPSPVVEAAFLDAWARGELVHARARGTAALLAAQKGPTLPVLPATPGH